MILGAALTVGVAYVYDSRVGAPSTTGSASGTVEHRQMVNWDVVGVNLRLVRKRAQEAWSTLTHKITS
jgi:hypothetical protein